MMPGKHFPRYSSAGTKLYLMSSRPGHTTTGRRGVDTAIQSRVPMTEEKSNVGVIVQHESTSGPEHAAAGDHTRAGEERPPETVSPSSTIASLTMEPRSAAVSVICLLSLFTFLAWDVFVPSSAHLFEPVDQAVHNFVSQSLDFEFRRDVADKLISNVPLVAGTAVSLAGMVKLLRQRLRSGTFMLALWAIGNAAVGGIGLNKDGLVTGALKAYFSRSRPSADLHTSYSFPSGHATSAYFVLGFLFFIIMPVLYEAAQHDKMLTSLHKKNFSNCASGINEPMVRKGDPDSFGLIKSPRVAFAATVAGASVTQLGRVLADVHYVSDVLAGACVGGAGALACLFLYRTITDQAHSAVRR